MVKPKPKTNRVPSQKPQEQDKKAILKAIAAEKFEPGPGIPGPQRVFFLGCRVSVFFSF